MTFWGLPVSAEIGGREYPVNADFRDVLEIIEILQDADKHERLRAILALTLFYEGFEEMPPEDYQAAFDWMLRFIALDEPEDDRPHPKMIDWKQDRAIIAAEINKVAGVEVRNLEYLHWWTFIGYFNGIGEGQLSLIVSIRDRLRKGKKLEKYEQEFYRNNRARVDFKQEFTQANEATLSAWLQ